MKTTETTTNSNSKSTHWETDTCDEGQLHMFGETWFIKSKTEKFHKCPLREEIGFIFALWNNTNSELNKLTFFNRQRNTGSKCCMG